MAKVGSKHGSTWAARYAARLPAPLVCVGTASAFGWLLADNQMPKALLEKVQAWGMDPVHFAIVGIVSLAFGLVTPPYGLCLMIACAIAKVRMLDVLKDTLIMLLPMFSVLALVIMWPNLELFIPRMFPPGTL